MIFMLDKYNQRMLYKVKTQVEHYGEIIEGLRYPLNEFEERDFSGIPSTYTLKGLWHVSHISNAQNNLATEDSGAIPKREEAQFLTSIPHECKIGDIILRKGKRYEVEYISDLGGLGIVGDITLTPILEKGELT